VGGDPRVGRVQDADGRVKAGTGDPFEPFKAVYTKWGFDVVRHGVNVMISKIIFTNKAQKKLAILPQNEPFAWFK
jgi:hypothetical protein